MPTLNWIGKDKIINHHNDVPFVLLDKKYTYGDKNTENMIIHGDNLYALKSLLPRYEGRINCIYIDPPYNTGTKEGKWVYSDNVDDPRIQKWLGEVVGSEADDLSRHDKWLCMMYPRLKIMHKLLADDGVIFISIDDNEYAHLKVIMDEIFSRNNFCATYFWKRTETPPSLSYKVRRKLEYVICYQKTNVPKRIFAQGLVDGGDAPLLNGGNPLGVLSFKPGTVHFNISDGTYDKETERKITLLDDVVVENGLNKYELRAEGHFKWGQDYLDEELDKGGYILVKSELFSMRYQKSDKSLKIPSNIIDSEVGVDTNETAKKELTNLGFVGQISFDYAKPVSLIKYLIKMAFYNEKNITILDCFAGSGTTGHAVLELNNEDGGNRKFIEVEMMDYAESITAERIRKITKGFDGYEPIKGSFSFYELGQRLFDEKGNISNNIPTEDLFDYIWYSETKSGKRNNNKTDSYLGSNAGIGYYFFYDTGTPSILNYQLLSQIKEKHDSYIIYADICLLSPEELNDLRIVFKKIPRDIAKI